MYGFCEMKKINENVRLQLIFVCEVYFSVDMESLEKI